MNRSSTSELPTSKQTIYPMTRQELAIPPVSWTRLRPTSPPPKAPASAPTTAKFAPLAHGSRESGSVGSVPSKAAPPQRHSIVETLRGSETQFSNSKSDAVANQPSIGDRTVDARTDIPERVEVAPPKFLKHAVRFGRSVTPLSTESQQSDAVGKFQKQAFACSIEQNQLNLLRGVDSRGQVYTTTAETASTSPAHSSKSALNEFFGEHHRSVESLPIIQVSSSQPNVSPSPMKSDSVPRTSAAASTADAVGEPTAEYPYWLQAAVQIVIGTIIVILVMNLHQLLRNGSPTQTIESSSESHGSYPVQQANLEDSAKSEFQSTR